LKKKILAVFLSVLLWAMFGASFVVTAADSGEAILIMGTTDSVESAIDPARAWDFFGWEIIQNTGGTLVEIEPGSGAGAEDFNPALATEWTTSTDGKTWTFTLREGLLFEDGTEFNASHVKYSFDRAIGIAHPDSAQVGLEYDGIIDSVEVVSKYEVRFNLKIPFSPFLALMACQASAIVNPEYAGGWKTDWSTDDIVWYTAGDARASYTMDLGPYKLTKWVRIAGKDTEMWLEANPNYWRSGYPKTEKIIIKFYADATALRLAIEAGDIDVAFRHITAADIEDLKDNPYLKVWEGTGAAIQYMIFQEDPVSGLRQLNDARIRRALAASLNRSELTNTVFLGQASPLYSIIPDGMMGHTEAFKVLGDANYTYARSLLAELGYDETNKLEIQLWYESSGHYPSSAEQAAVYKSQFEASGVITVREPLQGAEWAQYRENRNLGIMHVYIYGWYPDYIDPDNYAFLYYAVWLNHHYIDYGEHYAEMKAAFDAARATTVESERIELYAEIDDYAVTDCPVVPLWQGKAFAVTKPDVKGVYLDITQTLRMWYLYSSLLPPIASFIWEPEKPYVCDSVVFDASASYDPDGSIVSYEWDFSDGTTANTTEPIIEHTYNQTNTYTVTLTVTDNDGLTNVATAHITVIQRVLSIKLSGEHDYLYKEEVRIRVAALVTDAETMEPVSGANVTIEIFDPEGNLWISDNMTERLPGKGVYEWESATTIKQLMKKGQLHKGVYLVYVQASFKESSIATDILEFHIDPPFEEPIQLHTILLLTMVGVLVTVISIWYIDHRRLARKHQQLEKTVS